MIHRRAEARSRWGGLVSGGLGWAGVLIGALVAGGCTALHPVRPAQVAAWSIKTAAFPQDIVSRRLLIGTWAGRTTDLHGVQHVAQETRWPDGTYVFHFLAISPTGTKSFDQYECGRWGISGDIYFTITLSIRQGDVLQPVPADDPDFYDAYQVLRLTDQTFETRHVVNGSVDRVTRVLATPETSVPTFPGFTPCVGVQT